MVVWFRLFKDVPHGMPHKFAHLCSNENNNNVSTIFAITKVSIEIVNIFMLNYARQGRQIIICED